MLKDNESFKSSHMPPFLFFAGLGLLWWRFDWAVALAAGLLVSAAVIFLGDFNRKIALIIAARTLEKINGRK